VRGFVHTKLGELFATEEFATAFDRMVRVAHEQANAVLSGSASAVAIQGNRVTLDLAPFIDTAKRQLVEAGFTLAGNVPEVHPTIDIADATTLVRARTAYSTVDGLATWLPWVVLALVALGVYLARDHRRALVVAGLGFTAGMLVLAVALAITRGVVVASVPSRSSAPAAAAYDIVTRFLRDGLRTMFVLGLVVALGAFLAGPSRTAVGIRHAVVRAVAWLRTRSGLRASPWVYDHRTALRGVATGLAVVVFVFLDRPSGLTVLLIALLLAVCLAAIQLLARPRDIPVSGGEPGRRS